MTSEQERAFSDRADEVGRNLWPGRVKIAGVVYECELVKTRLELAADNGTGAVLEVEAIAVTISKAILPVCPAMDTIVKDLDDDGLYRVKVIDGKMGGDASWSLTCAKKV